MRVSKMIITFTDRYPFVGPVFWVLSVQYYLIQILVARTWSIPYSLSQNTISDLGNTACGTYGGQYVCSPLHSFMNASFITLGITMIIGSVLLYREFKESIVSAIGFGCMAIAGIGSLLVGLFPENTVSGLHVFGAGLVFLVGNVGLLILGSILNLPKSLRLYTLASGFIALIALVFLVSHTYLGIGVGGMERLTAYPQTMWLIVFGIYVSKNHYQKIVAPKAKR